MQTADWALVISIGSLLIASASFVWNIWAKFIYPKPRVRVNFSMMTLLDRQRPAERPQALRLSATNLGPIEVTLSGALVRFSTSPFKDDSYGLLNILPAFPASPVDDLGAGPFAGCLPKKLAVGEEFGVYLVADHESLAKGDYRDIGFNDTFGRNHWARRIDIIAALPSIRAACIKSGKQWRKR
jgi:hypothetical protein